MLSIQSAFAALGGAGIDQRGAQVRQQVEASNFDALLASFGTRKKEDEQTPADAILGMGGLNSSFGAAALQAFSGDSFDFSSEFASTFGLSGPLPEFISMISKKLNLSAEQNRALQDIAVANKDATRSQESVQKIAVALQQAGITA